MQFHTACLYLHQISLLNLRARPPSISESQASDPNLNWRRDIVTSAILSAHSFLSVSADLPFGSELGFNNTQWIQDGFCLLVACKLYIAAAKSPFARDTKQVRDLLDLSEALSTRYRRTEQLSTRQADEEGDRDVFYHYAQRGKKLKSWFDRNHDVENSSSKETEITDLTAAEQSVTWNTPQLPADATHELLETSMASSVVPFSGGETFEAAEIPSDVDMDDVFGQWMSWDLGPF